MNLKFSYLKFRLFRALYSVLYGENELILNLEDHLELSIEQIKNDLEYFTYPIFQENRNGRPELVASSVAIELGGSNFLCTAAHVLKNINENQPPSASFEGYIFYSLIACEYNIIFRQ